jgi:perosamine synthetase
MSNIQAAIGCAQMERIEELTTRKYGILEYYRSSLTNFHGICMNPQPQGTINGAWMPTVVFSPETGITRERLQAAFAAANIDARVFFWPLSSLPMFNSVHSNRLAWDIPGRAINLPSYHDMLAEDLDRVVMCVTDELMRVTP